MEEWILCMDIGGTNIRAGMIDRDFNLSGFVLADSPSILTGEASFTNLSNFIRRYIQEHAGNSYPIAISLGFPATIDKAKKCVVSAPNVNGINNIPIVDLLQKEYNIPVFIDRDVNMCVCYDMYKLNLESDGIIIACYLGTGFGNALWINGSIYSGYSGSAGELGHIPVLGKIDICGCGNKGCIEHYTSGKQLENIQSTYFPETDISDLFEYHSDEAVVEKFIEAISIPIATEINILDPEYVILGGGVIHMKGFPNDKLERFIRMHTRKPYPNKTLRIRYSIQKQENGVIGAGIYAFEQLEKENKGFNDFEKLRKKEWDNDCTRK